MSKLQNTVKHACRAGRPLATALQAAGLMLLLILGASPSLYAQNTDADSLSSPLSNAHSSRLVEFSIPAGALAPSLRAFAHEAGFNLSYTSQQVKGKTAPALRGCYSVGNGLHRLLADTSLRAITEGSGYRIKKPARQNGERVTRINTIAVEGETESAYGPVAGYKASRSATATRTDMPIINTPAAIQVIPRRVIEDQDATQLIDVVRNISSVQYAPTAGNRADIFLIRGFTAQRIARDDFLSAPSSGDAGRLGLTNVERVEVLKGPASVLYGLANPGGLINIVTKRPQAKPHYNVTARAGSFDFYKSDIDFNQPLTKDGRLLARLNASYQNSDSFRDRFIKSERTHIAPSLRWLATARTTIDLDLEYYKQNRPFDRGVIAVGGKALALPRRRFLGEPGDRTTPTELRLQTTIDHRLHENWSLRALARFSDSNSKATQSFPRGLAANGRTLKRRFFSFDQDYQNYALQANLTGKLETGPLRHQLLIGMDSNFTRFESKKNYRANLAAIDIFNPVYGATPKKFVLRTRDRKTDFYGTYLQDTIAFGRHWKLLLGGRYDKVKTQFDRNAVRVTDKWDRHFSPRAGLVYQPVKDLSLYASYTTSFLPPLWGARFDGKPLKPEEGRQFEAGVKRDWFGGRLSTTLAAYHLTRSNVLTRDPRNPGFSIEVGEQRSRGVEFDIAGEPAPGWRVIGSLAYMDAEVTRDNRLPVGNRLIGTPEWSGSFWAVYAFQDRPLSGLEIGGGVFAMSNRKADFANKVEAGGHERVDLLARYKVNGTVSLTLKVNNLFNEHYVQGMQDQKRIQPGAPRSVFGTLQMRF